MLEMITANEGLAVMPGSSYDPGQVRLERDLGRPFVEDGAVFNQAEGRVVGHNRMHPLRGQRCVVLNQGYRYDPRSGRDVPVRKQYRVVDLERRGIRSPTFNATTMLRKEQWIMLDLAIVREARFRLRAYADLAAACPYGGFNGMTKTILEHEVVTDPGEAIVDMNMISEGRGDAPAFQLRGMPLPIAHSSFFYDSRTLGISQSGGGTDLSTFSAEAAGRRVAETIEKTTIGNQTGIAYGGISGVGGYDITSQVYGYLNYPNRLTKSNAYLPTGNGRSGTGWVAKDTVTDVLQAINQLKLNRFFGPFMVYTSDDWDPYLDGDYILTGGNVATQTLRNRLRDIEDVVDVRRLDMLFSAVPAASTGPGGENVSANYAFTMIIVQLTPEVAQAVNGLDISTLQWEEKGGIKICFRVFAIQWPRLKSTAAGNTGLLQLTASQ